MAAADVELDEQDLAELENATQLGDPLAAAHELTCANRLRQTPARRRSARLQMVASAARVASSAGA